MGLLLVNAAPIILIFLVGRQLANSVVGLAAGMSYAVLAVSPSVLGFAGHATHFVLLPVLGGTLVLLKATNRQAFGSVFASGMLFGLGVLMKQPAVFFALSGAICLVSNNLHRRFRPEKIFVGTLIFSVGVILPLELLACFSGASAYSTDSGFRQPITHGSTAAWFLSARRRDFSSTARRK